MLKLMLGAIVLHHIRVTPLLGAAHRPREARGTFKVNNPCPTRRATSPEVGGLVDSAPGLDLTEDSMVEPSNAEERI